MSIKRLLIPTDFSETAQLAVAHGAYMAHLFKAKIFLLHVEEFLVYAGLPVEPVLMTEQETVKQSSGQRLENMADSIKMKYQVEISPLTLSDRPSKGIAEAVKENNIDLIIMGTHGASGFEEFFVGSNTHRVVNLAPCPVLSVQKFAVNVGFSNIVMPIDNDLHSRQKVNNVIELATVYKSTVHILGLLETDDTQDEKKFEIKLDSAENALKMANIPYTKKLVRGNNLASEAMNYCEKVNGDLIVIMSGHESNLTGMFLGTFAKQIVNHSKIPVLSIKPEETTIEVFDPDGGTGVII
ncbi:MAG TPA: universal stress protein [Bacteroidia bacterium]|jgi:nucleotide-binding universal stress UspA family protein|nr:universal stress protein [Bacteroidia bacterium]